MISFLQQVHAFVDRHVWHVKLLHQILIAWLVLLLLQLLVLNVLLVFSSMEPAVFPVLFMVQNASNVQTQDALFVNLHLRIMVFHVCVIILKGYI